MRIIFTGVLSFLPTKAFTLVCRPIHKHFGGDDITERQEHLHQLAVPKLLREVINKQVTALRPWRQRKREKEKKDCGIQKIREAVRRERKRADSRERIGENERNKERWRAKQRHKWRN